MIRHRPNKSGPVPMECPLEFSLKLLAGAWTPQIVWYLQIEPRRFGDLKRDLGNVSAKVLTTRLREMEKKGIITREVMPTSPPTVEYALTDVGRKIGPALQSIVEVGEAIQKHVLREKAEGKQAAKKVAAASAV
ncbi:MAG TPA: helix-turn-helix domain-containing protein [bacterium]|jgi:DNA-binding HxlR family transcriptional regulator|nr:helix-turn-helix domain-containing protein [bacterium]